MPHSVLVSSGLKTVILRNGIQNLELRYASYIVIWIYDISKILLLPAAVAHYLFQHSIIETCYSFLEQVTNSKLKTCNSLGNDIEHKILYHISDSKLYEFEIIQEKLWP
jgi:hypothetical protein